MLDLDEGYSADVSNFCGTQTTDILHANLDNFLPVQVMHTEHELAASSVQQCQPAASVAMPVDVANNSTAALYMCPVSYVSPVGESGPATSPAPTVPTAPITSPDIQFLSKGSFGVVSTTLSISTCFAYPHDCLACKNLFLL